MRFNEGCAHASISLAISLVYGTVAQSAVIYSLDDGSAEVISGQNAGITLTYANQFTAVAGGETIQDILIAWGLVPNGSTFTARLWSDPNGDGNPSDAIQLSSLASTVGLANSNTFETFDIPDVTLLVGQNFFVGFTMTMPSSPLASFPARIDTSPPTSNRSWVASSPEISSGFLENLDGDLMIRANGTAAVVAAVPEPTSLAIWGLGALGIAVSAARRQRKQNVG